MKVQTPPDRAMSSVQEVISIAVFLLEPKISLSEADWFFHWSHKGPGCCQLAGEDSGGAEPGQGRSLSCSNTTGMFSLGPCQVFGREPVIQLGAVWAPGFSGERWYTNAETGRVIQPPTCLGIFNTTQIHDELALIRTPNTAFTTIALLLCCTRFRQRCHLAFFRVLPDFLPSVDMGNS